MIRTETRVIEVKIYGCDFCNFEIEKNSGCCGTAPIMECEFCGKLVCNKHRELSYVSNGDYPDFISCLGCLPKLKEKEHEYYEEQKKEWEEE